MDKMEKSVAKRKRRSQKAIKTAFCELLMEKPFDKVYVREICERADYSYMAFYSNYEDKFDLAKKLIDDEAEIHAEMVLDSIRSYLFSKDDLLPMGQLYYFVNNFLKYVKLNELTYNVIFNNRMQLVDDPIVLYARHSTNIVLREAQLDYHTEIDRSFFAPFRTEMGAILLLNAVKRWMSDGYIPPVEEYAHAYCDIYYAIPANFSTNQNKNT